MVKVYFYSFILLLANGLALAQATDASISGIIAAEDGEPLLGATKRKQAQRIMFNSDLNTFSKRNLYLL